MLRGFVRTCGPVLGVLVLGCGLATAQDALDEGPSLEFRTNVPWARMRLAGDQSVAGTSPLRIPGPLTGRFWLEAGGPGVETQRGRVSIQLDDTGSRVVSYGPTPVREALFRSVLFPGHVQLRSRQGTKGVMMLSAGVVSGGMALWAEDEKSAARAERDRREGQLALAMDAADSTALLAEISEHQARATHFRQRRDRFLVATGVAWGVSLIDAVAFSPRLHVAEAGEASVTLRLRRKSRGRALLRSLVFPGLGQEYNGSPRKGFWIGTGAVGAGAYLLWRQDDLDRATAYVREGESRWDASDPADQIEREELVRELDDATNQRDAARWIAVVYWAGSLLDTVLSFEEPWGSVPVPRGQGDGLGWVVDPARGAVAARLRF